MDANPCPTCGRERGTGRVALGVGEDGEVLLADPTPSGFCEPCAIGIDPASPWPRERRPEFRDMPRTVCGWAEMPDGTLVAPGDQY
ncbi:hypothetical protein HUN59_14910 [Curtobacterium sp. Csp2]|uniref:hypothetical protein n=1 Tax=Curtobacterium sp. Csp2 TaxID=2495430 RepID=UPI0015805846|nr:hypothetical protein [Curtobacterium sp. Csp2]QKS17329.1 hypothetical protein HUN59_14910 [Curtobacterium sp. Csp2]